MFKVYLSIGRRAIFSGFGKFLFWFVHLFFDTYAACIMATLSYNERNGTRRSGADLLIKCYQLYILYPNDT